MLSRSRFKIEEKSMSHKWDRSKLLIALRWNWKDTNLNYEIVLPWILNLLKLFFLKNCEKIEVKNESYKLFFQEDALIALKNTIVNNFHIANPNWINQRFPCT